MLRSIFRFGLAPLLAMGLAVVFVPKDSAGGATSTKTPKQQAEGRDGDEKPPPGPGCIRILGEDMCAQPETAVAVALLAEGPQVGSPRPRFFSLQGFVRAGWPIRIDFLPQPGTRTELVVSMYEARMIYVPRRSRVVIDPDGSGGRRVYAGRITLPDEVVPAPPGAVRIASIEIESRKLKANGKVSSKRLPVEVYGMDVGPAPRALGSLGLPLSRSAFAMQPVPPASGSVDGFVMAGGAATGTLPRGKTLAVDYSYTLRERYDLVREDLWRHGCGFGCPKLASFNALKLRRGPSHGSWQLGSTGVYRMFVRAWMHCDTPDFRLCADRPSWRFGKAGPFRVQM
jgi:hypothetical protein